MFRRNERFDRQLMVIQEISRIQNANWATKHCEKCCVTDKHFGNPATSCYHQASPHVFQRYPFCLVVTPSQILMGEGKLLKYMASFFFKPRQTQKYHQKCMVCSEMSPAKLEKKWKNGLLELMNMHPNETPARSASKLPSRLEPPTSRYG